MLKEKVKFDHGSFYDFCVKNNLCTSMDNNLCTSIYNEQYSKCFEVLGTLSHEDFDLQKLENVGKFIKDHSKTELTAFEISAEIYHTCFNRFLTDTDEEEVQGYYLTLLDPEKEIDVRWHIDDVSYVIQDRNIELKRDMTDEEKMYVLKEVQHNHDANVGINWDVLEVWTECVARKLGINAWEEV